MLVINKQIFIHFESGGMRSDARSALGRFHSTCVNNEQRNIRDKSARYELKDGQLFFKKIDKVMGERLVRVVQKEEEKRVFERPQCGVYGSHFRRDYLLQGI